MTQELPFSPDTGEAKAHSPAAVRTLQQAMRRARADNAERSSIVSDLRSMRIARLELLLDALEPLVTQIPDGVEMFDIALVPGVDPRLFIDMIGFVEMGRNARLYRLVQDRRHGRVVLAESEAVDAMVTAVTDYVARRLIEREKALASALEEPSPVAAPHSRAKAASFPGDIASWARGRPRPVEEKKPEDTTAPPARVEEAAEKPVRRGRRLRRGLAAAFSFFIEVLGAVTFFLMLAFLGWILWMRFHGGLPAS